MKVIFLDFDGVMCLAPQWGGRETKEMKFLKQFPGTPDKDIPAWIKLDNFDFKATKVLSSNAIATTYAKRRLCRYYFGNDNIRCT